MAAVLRTIGPDTVITDDTRILGVEFGTDRAPLERTARAEAVTSTVRLPPVRTR